MHAVDQGSGVRGALDPTDVPEDVRRREVGELESRRASRRADVTQWLTPRSALSEAMAFER